MTAAQLPATLPAADLDPETGQVIAMHPAEVEPEEYVQDVLAAIGTLTAPLLWSLDVIQSDKELHDDKAGADVASKRASWVRSAVENLEKAMLSGGRHVQDHLTFMETARPAPRRPMPRRRRPR